VKLFFVEPLHLDNLAEEAMVNVEEDYQVCVWMLARGESSKSGKEKKRSRKKKLKYLIRENVPSP